MAWSGDHRAFIVEEFIRNGGSPVACYLLAWWYRVVAAFARFAPLRFFSLGLPQSKGLRTTSPNFGSSEGGDTTGSCCHYNWNDSQGHGQLPREATSVYQYSRPPLEWCFCSKHVDVKRYSVYFPELKKTFAVSSLVSNLLASQIGEFFMPYPVYSGWSCRGSRFLKFWQVTARVRTSCPRNIRTLYWIPNPNIHNNYLVGNNCVLYHEICKDLEHNFSLNMEADGASQTLVTLRQTTILHIPHDRNLHRTPT